MKEQVEDDYNKKVRGERQIRKQDPFMKLLQAKLSLKAEFMPLIPSAKCLALYKMVIFLVEV